MTQADKKGGSAELIIAERTTATPKIEIDSGKETSKMHVGKIAMCVFEALEIYGNRFKKDHE